MTLLEFCPRFQKNFPRSSTRRPNKWRNFLGKGLTNFWRGYSWGWKHTFCTPSSQRESWRDWLNPWPQKAFRKTLCWIMALVTGNQGSNPRHLYLKNQLHRLNPKIFHFENWILANLRSDSCSDHRNYWKHYCLAWFWAMKRMVLSPDTYLNCLIWEWQAAHPAIWLFGSICSLYKSPC